MYHPTETRALSLWVLSRLITSGSIYHQCAPYNTRELAYSPGWVGGEEAGHGLKLVLLV